MTTNAIVNNHHQPGRASLFRIIPVTVYGKERAVQTFAFLDDGSSITLIDNSLANQLGTEGNSDTLCLAWTGNVKRVEKSKRINLQISGIDVSHRYNISNVRTVRNLGLPTQSLSYSELVQDFSHLAGLPITDYIDATPRILIGVDNAHLAVRLKTREGKFGDPIATKTRLGWSVHGFTQGKTAAYNLHICECADSLENLHDLVKYYFSVEALGISLKEAPES